MINIYIVEDDRNILEIETYALTSGGFEVMGFENARDFFDELEKGLPDLLLLDVMLPDMDGIEILKRLRGREDTRNLPIIMVTAKATELDTVRGLDQGADDYISKPFGVMELISRVKALLRRTGKTEQKESYELGNITLNPESRDCIVNGERIELTYKEYELFLLLVRNAGTVLTRDVLMEKIWGIDFEGESRTLDMHIKTLRQKLGDESQHIQTVRNVGYVVR
ncbi:MAG: response regulator transcription factor [Eubacterium sp.]|nr:response regulator transcription factor [Eubacterium sp.]